MTHEPLTDARSRLCHGKRACENPELAQRNRKAKDYMALSQQTGPMSATVTEGYGMCPCEMPRTWTLCLGFVLIGRSGSLSEGIHL